jgi:hypothetical protein
VTTVIAAVVDATIVTALGLLACAALRRRPAALRHMILAASLAAGGHRTRPGNHAAELGASGAVEQFATGYGFRPCVQRRSGSCGRCG